MIKALQDFIDAPNYYREAYTESGMGTYFTYTLLIAVPAVFVTLFTAGNCCRSRSSWSRSTASS